MADPSPTPTPTKEVVSERDKPFVLAISSVVLFAGEIVAGIYLSVKGNAEGLNFLEKAMAATIGLVNSAWVYYLVKKNGQSQQ